MDLSDSAIEAIRNAIRHEIDKAFHFAKASPFRDRAELAEMIYA